jgi:hypothetical protein
MRTLEILGWEITNHTSHSPDLATTGPPKEYIRGQKFYVDDELKSGVLN